MQEKSLLVLCDLTLLSVLAALAPPSVWVTGAAWETVGLMAETMTEEQTSSQNFKP